MSETEFVPSFKQRIPPKNSSKDWLSFEEPQIIYFQGMRGSGKSAMVSRTVERLYYEGFLILHVWSARSLENLYYSINKNCKSHYAKLKIIVDSYFDETHQGNLKQRCAGKGLLGDQYEKFLDIAIQSKLVKHYDATRFELTNLGEQLHKRELLHCNCSRALPILLAVPDYIEFDKESVDRFNGAYFKDLKHYSQYFKEITAEEKKILEEGKLQIPGQLRPRPLIKIAHFTTPTSSDRKKKFNDEFTEIILAARKEHRIVVMNPSLFEGEMDKFDTLAEIFRMIPYLMSRSGYFKPLTAKDVGKAKKYWTKKQESWHKVAIVINELRSITPSSNLHADKESGKSKRAIFGFVPEARHFKTWFIADYQDPEDLYTGIKKQANLTIIKRGSRNILGENFKWLFDKVEYDRIGLARKLSHLTENVERIEHLKAIENRHRRLKNYLDLRRPYVDELPDNKAYITWHNHEIKLATVELPSFHHRQSTEDFLLDTGITWTVNRDKKPQETSALSKKEKKQFTQNKKKIKEDIMMRIVQMRDVEKLSWDKIKGEMVSLQQVGVIPQMGFEDKTPVYFSNWYGSHKKPEA